MDPLIYIFILTIQHCWDLIQSMADKIFIDILLKVFGQKNAY